MQKVSPESTTGKLNAQLCEELAAKACLDRASSAVATSPSFFFRRETRDSHCYSTGIKEPAPCCEFFGVLGTGAVKTKGTATEMQQPSAPHASQLRGKLPL